MLRCEAPRRNSDNYIHIYMCRYLVLDQAVYEIPARIGCVLICRLMADRSQLTVSSGNDPNVGSSIVLLLYRTYTVNITRGCEAYM